MCVGHQTFDLQLVDRGTMKMLLVFRQKDLKSQAHTLDTFQCVFAMNILNKVQTTQINFYIKPAVKTTVN